MPVRKPTYLIYYNCASSVSGAYRYDVVFDFIRVATIQ